MKIASSLLFAGITCISFAAIAQESTIEPQKLVGLLKEGGYVILIRHAAGDSTQKDAETVLLTDFRTQRNLSRQGRIDARGIGVGVDKFEIPVGRVLSSPYCRAMDTGRYAFARVDRAEALDYVKDNEEGKTKAKSSLTPLLSVAPTSGSNTVLITHSTNIQATLGFVPTEGEAVVFKPQGDSYKQIGRIRAQQWSEIKP
jgi:phosphohistidine phosphatase SixA